MKFRELFNEDMTPNWEKIDSINEFNTLRVCPQSKIWHKEGNTWTHVMKVLCLMYRQLDEYDSEHALIMLSAALCHDLGKPSTTKWDEEKGDYSTKHHGEVGERIVRTLFYDEDFWVREKVCYMVRWHMTLHHIFDKEEMTNRKLIQLSHGFVTVKDMLTLNMCDSLGSTNDIESKEFLENKWNRIKSAAETLNCFDKPFKFSNEYDKIRFFHFKDRMYPECSNLPKEYDKFNVYVMIGVPGSGKDTWIEKNLKGIPTVCRDDIRTVIGIKGEKPMGNKKQESKVTEIFNELMLEYCNKKQDFVINNTNVLKKYRDAYTDMVMRFMPNIIYIYVESPSINECKARRSGQMPMNVIDRMWNSLEFPNLTECNKLIVDNQRI